MKEPKPPSKQIEIKKEIIFDNWLTWNDKAWNDKTIPLASFQSWIEKNVPSFATNVRIGIQTSWLYDEADTYLVVSWSELINDPKYEKELISYEKKLRKWKKQQEIK